MINKILIATTLLLCSIFPTLAQNNDDNLDFKVIALFKNAAMIQHNGKQKMLRSGQTYLNKIKLISADSHKANFLINGKKISLGLHQQKMGGSVFSSDTPVEKKFILIPRDNGGMFRVAGFINGIQVRFLVDTGASQVAMNESTARRIGLQYKLKGQKVPVSTAAGITTAWQLTLKKVNVGGIEQRQVLAMVVKGAGPEEVLLGMTFLKQLKMQNDGELLRLTKKF